VRLLSQPVSFNVAIDAHTLPPTPPGPSYWYEIDLVLTIVDGSQSTIKVLSNNTTYVPGCTNCVVHTWSPSWDGTDAQGNVVTPGSYSYSVTMLLTAFDGSDPRQLQSVEVDEIATTPLDVDVQAAFPTYHMYTLAASPYDPEQGGIWFTASAVAEAELADT